MKAGGCMVGSWLLGVYFRRCGDVIISCIGVLSWVGSETLRGAVCMRGSGGLYVLEYVSCLCEKGRECWGVLSSLEGGCLVLVLKAGSLNIWTVIIRCRFLG